MFVPCGSPASTVGQVFTYREKQGFQGIFTQDQARSYILYRYDQGLKWQTINGDYSAMYKFYREVLDLPWDVKHIPRPRKERSLPPVLSQQEVQKLIEHGAIFKHQVFMALPHVFRHCYATHHLESGTNLVFLKEQMGKWAGSTPPKGHLQFVIPIGLEDHKTVVCG